MEPELKVNLEQEQAQMMQAAQGTMPPPPQLPGGPMAPQNLTQFNPNGQVAYMVPFYQQTYPAPYPPTMKKPISRHKFSQEEDALLRRLVEEQGTSNWRQISELMPGRNPRQCRERWKNYLAPGIRNDPWTEAEDYLLEEKVRELGPQWSRIAKCFDNRTDINVKNRWVTRESRINRAQPNEQIQQHQQDNSLM